MNDNKFWKRSLEKPITIINKTQFSKSKNKSSWIERKTFLFHPYVKAKHVLSVLILLAHWRAGSNGSKHHERYQADVNMKSMKIKHFHYLFKIFIFFR